MILKRHCCLMKNEMTCPDQAVIMWQSTIHALHINNNTLNNKLLMLHASECEPYDSFIQHGPKPLPV